MPIEHICTCGEAQHEKQSGTALVCCCQGQPSCVSARDSPHAGQLFFLLTSPKNSSSIFLPPFFLLSFFHPPFFFPLNLFLLPRWRTSLASMGLMKPTVRPSACMYRPFCFGPRRHCRASSPSAPAECLHAQSIPERFFLHAMHPYGHQGSTLQTSLGTCALQNTAFCAVAERPACLPLCQCLPSR